MRQAIIETVREIAERIGDGEGIEIVDVEFLGGGKARLLRLSIDKPGGVSHADCELISHRLGEALDAGDVIPGESGYQLEVSSPGVERKLSKPKDFERFTGQKIKVSLREAVESSKRFEGTLTAFDGETLSLETAKGKTIAVPLSLIDKANLKFDW